jgi:hypothetical protein
MAKTAIKLGQTMNLTRSGGNNIPLYANTGAEHAAYWLFPEEQRVKVIGISFNRRELSGNSLWIEVQSVKAPEKTGWCRFDCGGWDAGLRLRIDRVVFNSKG